MAQLGWDDTLQIFLNTLPGNQKEWSQYKRQMRDDESQQSIFRDIFEGSPGISYAKQLLPHQLGDTEIGKWLIDQIPENADPKSIPARLREGLQKLKLGGYSQEDLEAFRTARANDEKLRRNTVEVGKVPLEGFREVPTGDSNRAAMAQAAGVVAADVATDGLRNIWWFLNAPQAIAQIAVLNALHTAGKEYKVTDERVPLIKNRNLRLAATVPAVIGMSLAIGNAYRQPGYKAAVPSEADPKQTVDPLAELGSRYFLGRSGGLLPYDEFVKERPDVSRSEYEQYKQYLFGNSLPLKATLDGIHGPEVTFMGKSIPVATGVLPAVAAVLGARYGAKRAAARLAKVDPEIGKSPLQAAEDLRKNWVDLKKDGEMIAEKQALMSQGRGRESRIDDAYGKYDALQHKNELEVLKQTLLYSGGATAGTALLGTALESIRRATKGRAEIEPEEPEVLTPGSQPKAR